MKITSIETHILLVPDYDSEACSSAQDDLVVVIHTDEGVTGIGETDTNPWVAQACIHSKGTHCMALGLEEMLLGEDPMQPEAIWRKLYSGSKMTGRRGALICAMGAIDMALWDIRGKALNQPIYNLLGGATKEFITPYASLLPTGHTVKDYRESLVERAQDAKARGFKAGKMEVCIKGPYTHNAIAGSDEDMVDIVAACREALGADFIMMVDVAYTWSSAKDALRFLRRIERYDPYFLETPLDADDVEGHAFLADHSPIPIAAGEWLNTHFEFLDYADRGRLDVLQPNVGRVGGFTEARKVVQIAEDRGRLIVPHCWKTGIGIAASAHLCVSTPVCPLIEYLPAELCDSVLRKELVQDELKMVDGRIALPTKPGLGVELNPDAVAKYEVE